MRENSSRLTVFFEDPFWTGVYERVADGKLEVCKIVFGAQPKDGEVYDFLLKNWAKLRFSRPVEGAGSGVPKEKGNPKSRQRAIKKQLQTQGVGTKAQQALKMQQAQGKAARKAKSRLQKQAQQQRRFEEKQQKRKEKHRGK